MKHLVRLALAALCSLSFSVAAQVNVGVTLSLTGPAASLGIPARNTIELLPKTVSDTSINFIILDDASDPTMAVRNLRRLVEEHNVDVLIGSSTTPSTLSMIEGAASARVPLISVAASARIVEPQDDVRRWIFKAVQNESLMARRTVDHMLLEGVKTFAFIGFSNAYGEGWQNEIGQHAEAAGIRMLTAEKYASLDTSVTAQVLRIMSAKPDAVFIAASGTPAALPQKALRERGYTGRIYQTYGIANRDFLRIAGKDAEGAIFAVGPFLVADQLDAANPIRRVALDFIAHYENVHGAKSVSIFAANAWDAGLLLQAGLSSALTKAEPGTAEFRSALRDALESVRDLVTSQGVMNLLPSDHVGYDERAVALVEVRNSGWHYLPID